MARTSGPPNRLTYSFEGGLGGTEPVLFDPCVDSLVLDVDGRNLELPAVSTVFEGPEWGKISCPEHVKSCAESR